MSKRRIFIHTFGCQMNRLDSGLVADGLRAAGHDIVHDAEQADVVLFNTCSVRQHAEDKVYSYVGALKRRKRREPGLIIGILGCMAEKDGPGIFQRAGHVDIVCGPRQMAELPRLIPECEAGRTHVFAGGAGNKPLDHGERMDAPVQAFVAIIRGCNNYCTYCVVPYLRGPEVSRPSAEILHEVKRLADAGTREVTLLGQNVNSYGHDLDEATDFADMLAMVNDVPGIERIRFVTNHPKGMHARTIAAIADLPKVCEHIHVPAQAGSDAVLKAMKRRYTVAYYRDLVARIRERVPGVGLASDFIVGFPGETPEDFEATRRLVEDLRFQQCYIFKYSTRPGTAAAKLNDDVPTEAKKERNQVLLKLQERIQTEQHAALVGRDLEVMAEGPSKNDETKWTGRTRDHRIVVFSNDDAAAPGDLVRVRIESYTPLTMAGTVPRS